MYKNDIKNIFIPKCIKNIRRMFRYKKTFMNAYISYEANINLNKNIVIEKSSRIYKNVSIDVNNFKLGKFSTISGPTQIVGLGTVIIGDFCSIGPDVYIVTNNHNIKNLLTYPTLLLNKNINKVDHIIDSITIGNDVWIGRGVTILPGTFIPDGCVVAAGAVVTKRRYNPYSIIAGSPAKEIKKRFNDEVVESIMKDKIFDKEIEELCKYIEVFNDER